MNSNGLGNVYVEWYRNGAHYGHCYGNYWPDIQSFDGALDSENGQLKYISQDDNDTVKQEISNGFVWFMLDQSQGFTRAGIERINESVRSYTWAILGAQSRTRTSIIGVGQAFDAQKQFSTYVEVKISSPNDLPTSIANYQDVLCFARSKLDYVLGGGLYMVPLNMDLRIGTIRRLQQRDPGRNRRHECRRQRRRQRRAPTPKAPAELGPTAPPPNKHDGEAPPAQPAPPSSGSGGVPVNPAVAQDHENTKTALTVAAVAAGLAYYFLYR